MNRVMLILPYFGRFPNYFDLWMQSVAFNKKFDFLILTDQRLSMDIPENVYVHITDMASIKKDAERIAGMPIVLEKPYKLCDYRPMFGILFEKFLENYEFWGHCDPDIIFGNLDNFITDKILDKHDRVYYRGHLTLYRNNDVMNKLYLQENGLLCTYKDAFTTAYSCHFDERHEWNSVLKEKGIPFYNSIDYADIAYQKYRFMLVKGSNKDARQIYQWKDGKVTRFYLKDGKIQEDEWAYIHLQKRGMEKDLKDHSGFLIVPNKFIDMQDVTRELIQEYSRDRIWVARYKKRVKEIASNLQNGALRMRYVRFVRGREMRKGG